MTIQFEFVHANPVSNLKPGKSLQIRSRCMQGRNRHAGSRRSRQKERRQPSKQSEPKYTTAKRSPDDVFLNSSIPASVFNSSSTINTADRALGVNDRVFIIESLANSIFSQIFSPLDSCINFEIAKDTTSKWLYSDPAFLHSILTFSLANHDFNSPTWRGEPSVKTTLQLRKTLSLLQLRMCDEYACQHESAVYVVLNLAMTSAGFGDFRAAVAHLKGLQRIVQMRGGQAFLRKRPKLHFKLDRIDLIWVLSSGKQPFFQSPCVSWESILPMPRSALGEGSFLPPTNWDSRLANVFRDLQNLSRLINHSARAHTPHDGSWFQGAFSSIQTRLFRLNALLEEPIAELFRLAMLAFLLPMFEAPGCEMPFEKMAMRFRSAHGDAAGSLYQYDRSLLVWITIVIAPIVGAHDTQVRDVWKEISWGLVKWRDVKDRLMQTMWIEVVHDRVGEVVFNQLVKQ